MTAVSKPLYWSVGVPFNELFWASSTGALTENAANLLYLQKTVVDTASALETFSGGLLTNSVGALAITSNLDIATSQTSGILNIGTLSTREASAVINIGASGGLHTIVMDTSSLANTNAAPAIAIGTSASAKTVKINNNSNSVHCSSIDLKGASINHIVANSATPITIGDGQTNSVGGLLIGCSAAGNIRTSAPIKIGADSTSTCVITIGASGSSTSLLGSTTVPTLTFPSNLSNAVNSAYLTSHYVPNSTDTTLAGIKTFTSNILATGIGGASAGVGFAFCSTTTSGAVAMCNASVAGTIGLGQAASRTGSIGIGDGNSCSHTLNVSNGGSFSGTVNIANGASSSGTINLASGAGTTPTSAVNIASGTTSGAVTIGNANSTTALNGSVTLQKPLILGSIPTVNTQLGFQQDGIINASVVLTIAGGIKEVMSITIPNAGKYYLQANTAFPSIASLYNSTSISDSATVNNANCQTQMGSSGSGNNYHNISGIFTVTAGQIFYLLAMSGTVPQTMQVVFLRATRIA